MRRDGVVRCAPGAQRGVARHIDSSFGSDTVRRVSGYDGDDALCYDYHPVCSSSIAWLIYQPGWNSLPGLIKLRRLISIKLGEPYPKMTPNLLPRFVRFARRRIRGDCIIQLPASARISYSGRVYPFGIVMKYDSNHMDRSTLDQRIGISLTWCQALGVRVSC